MSLASTHPATRFALIVAAVALIAFVWVRAALTLRDVAPVRSVVRPTAVVWGGRVFTRGASFERWLHARGEGYAAWARKHQDAAKLLH